jgi:peptide/nickel transport system ATP-binding protein
MRSHPVLEVRDLKVHFPAGKAVGGVRQVVQAVNGVSLAVHRGSTFGIVGESGSGKSTIAQAIMQLVPPTAGSIVLGDTDLSTLSAESLRRTRHRFQMVFQDPFSSLNPRKKAIAAIREPLDLIGVGNAQQRDDVAVRMLEAVGLHADVGCLFPHQFSGGQRQRLCIARALASEPELIVCDEPVSALDVAIQAQILNLLKDLQRERNLSYVFISHDLAVVQYICTEVAVMYLGEFVEKAPAAAIFAAPRHPYTWSLMAAALSPDDRSKRAGARRPVPMGEPPSPLNPPPGCRFSPRCAFVTARCREEKPALRRIGDGHLVACHFAEILTPPLRELRAP